GTYSWYYEVDNVGYKYHGNSIMAAMGLISIKYVDEDNIQRRQICDWYDELLSDEPQNVRVPIAPNWIPSRHLYKVLVENRDEVMAALNRAKIYPGVHYRDNTLYTMYDFARGTCPNASHASDHLISLPLHLRLKREDVERVARELKAAVRELAGVR